MALQGQPQASTQWPPASQAQAPFLDDAPPALAATAPRQEGIPILRSWEGVPQQGVAGPGYPSPAPHYPISSPGPVVYGTPWVQPAPIYYAAPVMPVYPAYGAYGYRPFYPPIGISLHLGYSRSYGHRGRWR
jgi:hypothetical protein